MTNDRPEGYFSTSLARGFAILETFAAHPVQGISDLAERLHMSVATVHRYTRTLEHLGYLRQDEDTKRYALAPGIAQLGPIVFAPTALRRLASTNIRELSRVSGHAVNIAVLDDLDILYVDRAVAPMAIDAGHHPGSRLPAYCTSMGKALLASLGAEELNSRLRRFDYAKHGPNTLVGVAPLLAELQEVRHSGIALNNEESRSGLRSIAATISGRSGIPVAAINVAVRATEYTSAEMVRRYARPLARVARAISTQIAAAA